MIIDINLVEREAQNDFRSLETIVYYRNTLIKDFFENYSITMYSGSIQYGVRINDNKKNIIEWLEMMVDLFPKSKVLALSLNLAKNGSNKDRVDVYREWKKLQ